MSEDDDVVIPFPSLEDREVERITKAFRSAYSHDATMVSMMNTIMSRLGLEAIIKEVAFEEGVTLEDQPLNAGLLAMYYPIPSGGTIKREEMDFDQWSWNVDRLKRDGDTDQATALDRYGLLHFEGVIRDMMNEFIEKQERA